MSHKDEIVIPSKVLESKGLGGFSGQVHFISVDMEQRNALYIVDEFARLHKEGMFDDYPYPCHYNGIVTAIHPKSRTQVRLNFNHGILTSIGT